MEDEVCGILGKGMGCMVSLRRHMRWSLSLSPSLLNLPTNYYYYYYYYYYQ